MSADEISLTLPADEAFHSVAHLVLGGLAVRLDLTFEHLEDLELALDTLLDESPRGQEVTVRVRVGSGELTTIVGPFASVRRRLEETGDASLSAGRILATVCDRVDVSDHDGAEWVELTKHLGTATGATA